VATARASTDATVAPRVATNDVTRSSVGPCSARQEVAWTKRGDDAVRSSGSWPASTAKSRATSATERPMGPGTSWLALIGTTPPVGTVPTVGLRPTTPLTEAGHTMDPSVSVPTASGTRPAASAAPDPTTSPRHCDRAPTGSRPDAGGRPAAGRAFRADIGPLRQIGAGHDDRTRVPQQRDEGRVDGRAADERGRAGRPGSPVTSM